MNVTNVMETDQFPPVPKSSDTGGTVSKTLS